MAMCRNTSYILNQVSYWSGSINFLNRQIKLINYYPKFKLTGNYCCLFIHIISFFTSSQTRLPAPLFTHTVQSHSLCTTTTSAFNSSIKLRGKTGKRIFCNQLVVFFFIIMQVEDNCIINLTNQLMTKNSLTIKCVFKKSIFEVFQVSLYLYNV